MKNLKKKSMLGFTLIELMIVVAIIGILAVVAIPNYQRFQAKAKQSEAKSMLSGIYTAEKAFYAEYSQYTTCVSGAGFVPDGWSGTAAAGAHKGFYNVGSLTGGSISPAGYNCKDAAGAGLTTAAGQFGRGKEFFPGTNTAVAIASTAVTASTFTMNAIGYISTGTINDVWTINDTKNINNNVSGI